MSKCNERKVVSVLDYTTGQVCIYYYTEEDLKDYVKFKNILIQFKKFYNIDEYNLRDIDKYLWIAGKEYFPKKY